MNSRASENKVFMLPSFSFYRSYFHELALIQISLLSSALRNAALHRISVLVVLSALTSIKVYSILLLSGVSACLSDPDYYRFNSCLLCLFIAVLVYDPQVLWIFSGYDGENVDFLNRVHQGSIGLDFGRIEVN
ncbi:hypothetical protein VNO77_08167 [Canavalia gladiata]|uniref:Uncharacterized protein n=1 Tax=Canavalia gladiata TaxID=3824 RepID=A0AAN9QWY4_CANGL